MFLRRSTVLLAAFLSWPLLAAEFDLTVLMQMLALVPTVKNTFAETKHSAVLSTPLVLKGTLAYVRPDRLEKNVLAPYDERTVIAGDSVTIENRTLKQSRTYSLAASAPVSAFVESLRATLAGDRSALEHHYAVRLEGKPEAWLLILIPREQKFASLVKRVQIAGERNRLKRIEVEETTGDRSVMLIGSEQP